MNITLPVESLVAFIGSALAIGWTINFMMSDPNPIDWEQDYGVGCSKAQHVFKLGQKYCFCGNEVMREGDMRGLIIVKS